MIKDFRDRKYLKYLVNIFYSGDYLSQLVINLLKVMIHKEISNKSFLKCLKLFKKNSICSFQIITWSKYITIRMFTNFWKDNAFYPVYFNINLTILVSEQKINKYILLLWSWTGQNSNDFSAVFLIYFTLLCILFIW